MQEVIIKRPVSILTRVTEGYKKQVAAEIQEAIAMMDAQIQQLEFQFRRALVELEKRNPQGIPAAKQHLEKEQNTKRESKQRLLEKLKEVADWAIGQEVLQGQAESTVKVQVGDSWSKLMGVKIVIEDDVVVEIRQGD